LIGGGPGGIVTTRKHIQHALKGITAKNPLVAYVGAASDDNAGFAKMLSGLFLGTGARLEMVKLAKKSASVATARQLLADSDLVFVSGGDVDHGMHVLAERDVAEDLRRLARDGKPFVGISAGSIMMCRQWVRFVDDDDAKAEPFDCLGIVPLHMDAHSEDDEWSELRVLVHLLARRDGEATGYGVPSKGCLRVEHDAHGAATPTALGAPVVRISAKGDGAVVVEPPLEPA
jgi:peptidase E